MLLVSFGATPISRVTTVSQQQRFSKAPVAEQISALVSRLAPEDRELLSSALDRERVSAIHDVLATLTWWLDTGRITWASRGKPLPAGIEGGLHLDYVGRLDGWSWPDE